MKNLLIERSVKKRKLTHKQVRKIRDSYNNGVTCYEMSKMYKMDRKTLLSIVKKETYKNVI